MREFSREALKALAVELPEEVAREKAAGEFDKAKAAIAVWLQRPIAQEMRERLLYEEFILGELAGQFPYTEEDVLRLMQEKIPDFSTEDLARAEQKNLAEWIYVGGKKHYIHNLMRNLMDKDTDLRARAGLADVPSEKKELLLAEIRELKEQGISRRRFHLRASIRLKDTAFEPGMWVRAHLPLPAPLFQTSDVEILAHSGEQAAIDGADSLFRTICFEERMQENHSFWAEYAYTVTARYVDLWKKPETDGQPFPEEMREFLDEQYPHIRFTPYLRALAAELTAGADTPLEKARNIYDYITKNIQYSYMRPYALMPDIPQYCARNLRGDCGVQALLFITLCRICGVPARWQSGFYANPEDLGIHDWAMFYIAPYGWLYADPSFGGAAHADGDEERRRFYFGNLDPLRMTANHAFQQKFAVEKRFMPMDPYDNQTGEMESDVRGFGADELEFTKEILEYKKL